MKELYFGESRNAAAHYAPAVYSDKTGLVFVSGMLPTDPHTRTFLGGDVEQQIRQALKNLEEILTEVGLDRNAVVRTNAYIDEMENWEVVNRVYAEFFGEHRPARTILCVKELHFGAKIEIDAIAEKEGE